MSPPKDDNTKGEKKGKLVTDSRFAQVHYDPRFQRFPKNNAKIQIDERFAGMFTDPSFEVRSTIDKRGRKVKQSGKNNEDMRRYYHLQDEEKAFAAAADEEQQQETDEEQPLPQEQQKQRTKKAAPASKKTSSKSKPSQPEPDDDSDKSQAIQESESNEEAEEDSDEDSMEEEAQQRWARMRGLTGPVSSSDEEEEDDDDDSNASSGDEDGLEAKSDSDLLLTSSEEEDSDIENEGEYSSDDEETKKLIQEWGIGAMAANPEEDIILLPDATKRLAAVDLDWEHLRAVDIFVALRGFLPQGGKIEKVTVYPSDYGLERMAEEATAGPRNIWKPKSEKNAAQQAQHDRENVDEGSQSDSGSESEQDEQSSDAAEDSEEDSDDEDSDDGMKVPNAKQIAQAQRRKAQRKKQREEEEGAIDRQRLQLYERSKLRWYYAIIECDSVEAANRLYEECDGMEIMKTACKFDLRFVPDDQSFASRQIRDQATDIPDSYQAPIFQTKALQHTKVELTWDADDSNRTRVLKKKVTADELKEDDFKAYLASDGEEEGSSGGEESENEEEVRERYRRLLLSGGGGADEERKGKKDWDAGTDGDDESSDDEGAVGRKLATKRDKDMEMEVTFVPGLENLGERLLAKKRDEKARQGETVWDAYVRRRREKKMEAKRLGKAAIDSDDDVGSDPEVESGSDDEDLPAGVADDPFFQHDDDPFDDPFFKGAAKDIPDSEDELIDPATASKSKSKSKKKDVGATKKASKAAAAAKEERAAAEAEKRRQQAELEMLLMDEETLGRKSAVNGTSNNPTADGSTKVKKLSKKERAMLKKEAKRRQREVGSDDDELQDMEAAAGAGFEANIDDPRFAGLITSKDFALDPTDPRFSKGGSGASKLAREVAKRRTAVVDKSNATAGGGDFNKAKNKKQGEKEGGNEGVDTAAKADLKLLVASLKRKAVATGVKGGQSGSGGVGSGVGKKAKKTKF